MLYLASSSPQRTRLLAEADVPHVVVAATVDESTISAPAIQILALDRAAAKARTADLTGKSKAAPCVVLGADTVVGLGKEMFGKPRDRADAVAILSRLQGTTHTVVTGHCLLLLDAAGTVQREARGLAIAKVTMRHMSADDIQAYVDSGESDGRAGAYAIQENGDRFVVDLEGGFDTVVGLHLDTVSRLWRECTDSPLPGYIPAKGPGSGSYPAVS